MIEDLEAELTGSLKKLAYTLNRPAFQCTKCLKANKPVSIQVGVRITKKITNLVLHESSSFLLCCQKLRRFLEEINEYILKNPHPKGDF